MRSDYTQKRVIELYALNPGGTVSPRWVVTSR